MLCFSRKISGSPMPSPFVVLMAEDNPDWSLLAAIAKREGFDVLLAADGAKALAIVAQQSVRCRRARPNPARDQRLRHPAAISSVKSRAADSNDRHHAAAEQIMSTARSCVSLRLSTAKLSTSST